MNIGVIIILVLVTISGCKYSTQFSKHSEKSYISSVVSKRPISTGFVLTLKEEEVILGVKQESNTTLEIRADNPLFSVQETSQYLFFREKAGIPDIESLFYVYDIAPDRYVAIRKQFEILNIEYYTNDFSKGILWVPVSCNIDIATCQHEINLIADEYEKSKIKAR